ncbi:MAG: hypothetical protein KC561_02050 [Myxococcales bacterium]|nr:hypothetical protein [Myxococcales bacterium]
MEFDRVVLPERRSVVRQYIGPRQGFARATQSLYAWVGTYFSYRVGEVTVCYSKRPKSLSAPSPKERIRAEARFDVDDDFAREVSLPHDLSLIQVPREEILFHFFVGKLDDLRAEAIPWMKAAEEIEPLVAGFRQRIIRMPEGKSPSDEGWEVETQLVVAP